VRTVHRFGAGNLISLSEGDFVRVWDVATGRLLQSLPRRGGVVEFAADGRTVVAAGTVGEVGANGGAMLIGGVSIDAYPRIYLVDTLTGGEVGRISYRGATATLSSAGWLASGAGHVEHLDGNIISSRPPNGENPTHEVRVWETATLKEVLTLAEEYATVVRFSPDGRTLAAGTWGGFVKVWDLVAEGSDPKRPAGDVGDEELGRLWDRLADAEPRAAFTAVCTLAGTGDRAVRLFRGQWRKPEAADAERVRALIARLGSDRFAEREAATGELTTLGLAVLGPVRQALADRPAPEVARRLEAVLAAAEKARSGPDELRRVRAVQALGLIGSPAAREMLAALAGGPPGAPHVEGAKALGGRFSGRGR
jgi:hypothetical protein